MRRIMVALATLFFVSAISIPSAVAESAHFKKGGEPTCTISRSSAASTSTTCRATLAGLGNQDVDITTTVGGFAVYTCQNQGGNTAAGQNKVLVGPVTEPTHIDASAVKNGNLTFVTNPAVLTAPTTVTGAQAGCPNPNWTGVNPTLTLTSIELTISQGGVQLFDCKASNPQGLSGTVSLTC